MAGSEGFSMRRVGLAVLFLILGACGADSEPAVTEAPGAAGVITTQSATPTTEAPSTTVVSTLPVATTSVPTTTTALAETTTTSTPRRWTVASAGRNPDDPLGSGPVAGSGCAPGSDQLPDGVWFGWLDEVGGAKVEFDLACLIPGQVEPVVSNNNRKLRTIPVGPDAMVYAGRSDPAPYAQWRAGDTVDARPGGNAPGLPATYGYWLFVNDGAVTELSRYPGAVAWREGRSADWPPIFPGCCDGGTVAPPSPPGPLPASGWPADGFYYTYAEAETSDNIDLMLGRWSLCRDHPGTCPEWWTGDEVFLDGDTIERRLEMNRSLQTVVRPIWAEAPIIGTGAAFGDLRAAIEDAAAKHGVDDTGANWEEIIDLSSDPDFPFAYTDDGAIAYRGPGGVELTTWDWWYVLEMRDGKPILYADAGIVAG
jgi:hypothetical protein